MSKKNDIENSARAASGVTPMAVPARPGTLLGRFSLRIDPKHRITIPSIFRSRMANPDCLLVVPNCNGLQCLDVFHPAIFEERLAELNSRPMTDLATSNFVTMIGSVSETLDLDVQGRIRIGDELLRLIGVDRDVVLIGAFNRIQVWAAGNEPSFKKAMETFPEVARTFGF